ncbi:hypothetical protein NQZ68_025076 [Dissostichus eleginoides]|nr:hypothetical protein NQZ68_025076 [Dissostichus eleginoides]
MAGGQAACVLHIIITFIILQRSRKQIKHGNWKNDWTFSLAEDGGGGSCKLEAGLCVCLGGGWRAGGERKEGEFRCHVSRLAPLASRLGGCWTENLPEPVRLLSEPKVGSVIIRVQNMWELRPLHPTVESQRRWAFDWQNILPDCSTSSQPAGFGCLKEHVAKALPLLHHLAQPGYQAEESVHQHRSGLKLLPPQTQQQQNATISTF